MAVRVCDVVFDNIWRRAFGKAEETPAPANEIGRHRSHQCDIAGVWKQFSFVR
jgi:hypothetical protein